MNLLKKLIVVTVLSKSILASQVCIDKRIALIQPCPEGQERVFEQGNCPESYHYQSSYCAMKSKKVVIKGSASIGIEFDNFQEILISGEAILAEKPLDLQTVNNYIKNSIVTWNPGKSVGPCLEGIFTIILGEGNLYPNHDGTESYTMPNLVNFMCINK